MFNKWIFCFSVFDDMQAGFGMNVALNYFENLVNDSLLLYQIMIGVCKMK